MIYADVSEIPTTGCNVLDSSGHITNYNGRNRKQFAIFGNKYLKYSDYTSSYNYDTSSYVCYSDLSNIVPSPFEWVEPFYSNSCIIISVAIIVFSILLVPHKFWRKL